VKTPVRVLLITLALAAALPLVVWTSIFQFRMEDSPQVKREKCDRLHGWWNEHGRRYHSWGRVWSSRCAG
jgi:hypothetical protein